VPILLERCVVEMLAAGALVYDDVLVPGGDALHAGVGLYLLCWQVGAYESGCRR